MQTAKKEVKETMPTSFRGSKSIIGIGIVLASVLGVTVLSVRLKLSAELEFFKRKNAIVKAENEMANKREIKGIESQNQRGY